eukprot:12548410-Ditylum_brightwellii.AAC.1
MDGAAKEKVTANVTYFDLFNMTADHAKYDIQLRLNRPNLWYKGKKVKTDALGDNTEKYKDLLREQNAYLVNYADFCVGGLTEAMLSHE